MKLMTFLIGFVFFITACNETNVEVIKKFEDGTTEIEREYKIENGEKVLVRETQYYSKDSKYLEREIKDSLADGLSTVWYKNGNKWSEGYFKNGLANGKRTVWYENGKIRYEGEYKEGEAIGIWRFYDEQGKQVNVIDYNSKNNKNDK